MLGGSQLLNWFSTRFSTTRFPQWEPIDTRKCENPTENRPQVLIWPRTGYETRFKCIHIYVYIWEPDRFSHITKIRFSELCVFIYGFLLFFFSLGTATLVFTAITVLPLLLFSLYWDLLLSLLLLLFSPFLLFFSCCCYFSHMVLLFSCDEVI
jgi:hypothetical protein